MPKYMLIMRGTDESNAAMMADIDASGPAPALAKVDELIASDRLPGSHLVPTVRGELLTRLGRRSEARAELELAARLCANQRERSVLLRKAATLG
jgi:predicted RNA polymerase sigma factor